MTERENESIYDAEPKPAYHELCDSPACRKCREWWREAFEAAVALAPRAPFIHSECNCGEPECGDCAAQARALTQRSLEAEARANAEWARLMIALDREIAKP